MQSDIAAECQDDLFETSSNIHTPNLWEFGQQKSPNNDGSFTFRQIMTSDFDAQNQHSNPFNNFGTIDDDSGRYSHNSPNHSEDLFNNNHRQYTANYVDDAIT